MGPFAKAAPYCHPKLASTELSGPNNGKMEVVTYTDADRAKALAMFMAKTAKRGEALESPIGDSVNPPPLGGTG